MVWSNDQKKFGINRVVQPTTYKRVLLSILYLCMGGFALAEENTSLLPCDAYSQFLNSGDQRSIDSRLNASDCITYENFVMQAKNWRDFQLKFERSINRLGYPIHIGRAFEDWRLGRGGAAILRLDAASSTIHQSMIGLGDSARAEIYIYLVKSARNLILADFVEDEAFLAQLSGIKKPVKLDRIAIDGIKVARIITCLIQVDAMTARIEVVLDSAAFLGCTKS